MSVFDSRQKTSASLLGAVLVGGMLLGGSAFAVEPLGQGLQLAAASAGEGKCGEGKCGSGGSAKTSAKA
ncbi:EF-hand domain-containing protein, partial [Pseudomonas aeruginosa]|nr:EF-hand domain-containing protein [Pseudomonas aeruginosa]